MPEPTKRFAPDKKLMGIRDAALLVGVSQRSLRKMLADDADFRARVAWQSPAGEGIVWIKMPALEAWLRGEEATLPPAD